MDLHIILRDDGQAQAEMELLLDSFVMAMMEDEGVGLSDLEREFAGDPDVTVERVQRDQQSGIKLSSKVVPVADIAGGGLGSTIGGPLDGPLQIDHKPGWLQSRYTVSGHVDMSDMAADADPLALAFLDAFDMKFRVTFPGKVKNHNATTVDGQTLVWELVPGSQNRVEAEITYWNQGNVVLLVGLLLLVVAGAVGAVIFVRKRGRAVPVADDLGGDASDDAPDDGADDSADDDEAVS